MTSQSPEPSPASEKARLLGLGGLAALLLLAFIVPLTKTLKLALESDMHSHTPLIPLISGYLLFTYRDTLSRAYKTSLLPAVGFAFIALAFLLLGLGLLPGVPPFEASTALALVLLALLFFLYCGGFLFLGAGWMRTALFPLAFLIFSIPLPLFLETGIENALVLASADATAVFFSIFQVPFVRDGVVFQLPGITIEVAQECSGIRSTYVLFITSLLIAYLFLRSPWRRAVLVAAIIPLGIIRNGFRILVIGWLCVEVDPHMIDSFIHRKGGPIFFVLSLIPLFLLLLWLRRGERPQKLSPPPI